MQTVNKEPRQISKKSGFSQSDNPSKRFSDELREVARRYYIAGLNVLPANRAQKRPVGSWKKWIDDRPNVDDFNRLFAGSNFDALAIVCGKTSGGLEIIDFDQKGAAFESFKAAFGSLDGFPIESTQSGGKHIGYRSENCENNQKLANLANGEVLIETRGQGGICLVAPSDGYELKAGNWERVPTLDADERARLLELARSFDQKTPKNRAPVEPRPANPRAPFSDGSESAADYLRNNLDIERDALARAGWTFLRVDESGEEYWRRPNQTDPQKPGATLHTQGDSRGLFYCFTSSAPPFEPSASYSPLQVVALLDFGGDESAASKAFSGSRRATGQFAEAVAITRDGASWTVGNAPIKDEKLTSAEAKELEAAALDELRGSIFPAIINERGDELARELGQSPTAVKISLLFAAGVASAFRFRKRWGGDATPPEVNIVFCAPSQAGKGNISKAITAPLREIQKDLNRLARRGVKSADYRLKATKCSPEGAQRTAVECGSLALERVGAYLYNQELSNFLAGDPAKVSNVVSTFIPLFDGEETSIDLASDRNKENKDRVNCSDSVSFSLLGAIQPALFKKRLDEHPEIASQGCPNR